MISAITSFTRSQVTLHKPGAPPAQVKTDAASPVKVAAPASSALKPFAEVARDARAALDAGYEKIGKEPHPVNSLTGKEWDDTGLADLDRRTVFAIASNEGGQFSKWEVSAAKSEMSHRNGKAIKAVNPHLGSHSDSANGYKASVAWMDAAGPEERATLEWAHARASAQKGYEYLMEDMGKVPDNLDNGDPVVRLFMRSWDEIFSPADDRTKTPSFLAAVELWTSQSKNATRPSWVF